jgi:catalase
MVEKRPSLFLAGENDDRLDLNPQQIPTSRRLSLQLLTLKSAAPLVAIAAIVAAGAAAFAWAGGWLTPHRLNADQLLGALSPPSGPVLGYRRNHAKGICFTGEFDSNGMGAALSTAQVFVAGRYPVIGRFNLGVNDPHVADAMARVRGLSLRVNTPDGREWRSAMVSLPFFPVSTPEGFYELLSLSKSKDPSAAAAFTAAHPEFGIFGRWAKTAPWTASFAQERYNSIDAFVFIDAAGQRRTVRWAYLPAVQPVPVSAEDLARRGPDFLEADLKERVSAAPLRFPLVVMVAGPHDLTADPSKAWPPDREAVAVGTLIVSGVQGERDGACRDIAFDPTVLPDGMQTSDDPFPAARSAAYARSFDKRTGETAFYPYTTGGAQ